MPDNKRLAWQRSFRLLFAAALAGVAVLSLAPLGTVPGPPGSDKLHHAAVYGMLTALGLLAYPPARSLLPQALGLLAYGGALELLQGVVPGRFADVGDFLANAVGIGAAICAAILYRWRYRARH